MILNRKIKLSDLNSSRDASGIILLRFLSKLPMDKELVVDQFIASLNTEIRAYKEANNPSGMRLDRITAMENNLTELSQYKIVYSKEENIINDNGQPYFYFQIVLEKPEDLAISGLERGYSFLNQEGNLYSVLYDAYDYGVGPRIPMEDFTFSFRVVNIYEGRYGYINRSTDTALNHEFEQLLHNSRHNLAFSFKTNTNKQYNRSSMIRISYCIYDNLIKAMEDKDKDTMVINQFDLGFGAMSFATLRQNRDGNFVFKIMYKSKPKLEYYKDMAVFYDGTKSYELTKTKFEEFASKGVKMLNILQYCSNKDFFYTGNMLDPNLNKIVLHFVSKDRIYMSRSEFRFRGPSSNIGLVCINPGNKQKKQFITLALNRPGHFLASFVVPVDENNIQERAVNIISNLISEIFNGHFSTDGLESYKLTLLDEGHKEDDILSQWFTYCTKASKTTDDGIIKAYMKMKENLEKEYKEISTYLNCYDFSKCSPIPRVSMDKKLKNNYYKSLHVEPKSIIIKSINNKKIKPIQELQTTIKFMAVLGKNDMILQDLPVKKYYNPQGNVIELYYNKLKGDAARAKVENRR